MKNLRILLPALLIVLLATSCEKDDPIIEPEPITFTLAIHPKVGSENLVLNQEYMDQEDYRIMPTLFRFYLSNITLISADNSELEIADYALFDLKPTNTGEPLTLEVTIPGGSYTGIKFWLGLDSTQNASDPSTFEQSHPLSNYQGTFWTWNTGYRFVMLEGYYDTIQNTPGPVSTTKVFNYHTGTNPMYREVLLDNASVGFTVADGDNYTYNLDLDLNKVFYGTEDIDRSQGAITHGTGSGYPLAEKFTENFRRAFSLSAP